MKLVKRVKLIFAFFCLIGGWNLNCIAAENAFSTKMLKNDVLNQAVKKSAGVAVLFISGKPGRGMSHALKEKTGKPLSEKESGHHTQQSLLEINGNDVTFDIPMVRPDLRERKTRGSTFTIIAELISGTF
jgi:hypothetical protein